MCFSNVPLLTITYIMLELDLQFMFLFMCHLKPSPSTTFTSLTYEHIRYYFPHFFMPLIFLLGCELNVRGSLALIRKSAIFFCFLNAIKGGSGKTDFKYWSWIIDRQCFLCKDCRSGNLGSSVTAKIGLLLWGGRTTFFRACALWMALDLQIAASTKLGLYFLSSNIFFSSEYLCYLSSTSVHTLVILNAKL